MELQVQDDEPSELDVRGVRGNAPLHVHPSNNKQYYRTQPEGQSKWKWCKMANLKLRVPNDALVDDVNVIANRAKYIPRAILVDDFVKKAFAALNKKR